MHTGNVIVLMAKQPQSGHTKTRLTPPLTIEEAAELYTALLQDSLDLATSLQGVNLAIAISPPESRPYFKALTPPGTLLLPISGADIGICLAQTTAQLLNMNYGKVIALSADGPSLPPEYLHLAVNLLDTHPLVFGPSLDGGYYLVGLTQPQPDIFTGIDWSTTRVLEQSLQKAAELGLKAALTPDWYDIDTAQDLLRLVSELNHLPPARLVNTRQVIRRLDLIARLF